MCRLLPGNPPGSVYQNLGWFSCGTGVFRFHQTQFGYTPDGVRQRQLHPRGSYPHGDQEGAGGQALPGCGRGLRF